MLNRRAAHEIPDSPVAAGSTAIRALPAKKPCWRLTACPCLPFLFFGAGNALDGGDDEAFVGALRAASATARIGAAADEGLFRLQKAAQRTGRISCSARGAACAPWSTPLDTPPPIHAAEIWPRGRACRGPSIRQQETTSRDPSASDETRFPQSPTPADDRFRTHRSALEPSASRPAVRLSRNTQSRRANAPGQVLDALLLGPEPHRKLQKPTHPIPEPRSGLCYPKARCHQEHLANLRYLEMATAVSTNRKPTPLSGPLIRSTKTSITIV
jgi:hypothetical protein